MRGQRAMLMPCQLPSFRFITNGGTSLIAISSSRSGRGALLGAAGCACAGRQVSASVSRTTTAGNRFILIESSLQADDLAACRLAPRYRAGRLSSNSRPPPLPPTDGRGQGHVAYLTKNVRVVKRR